MNGIDPNIPPVPSNSTTHFPASNTTITDPVHSIGIRRLISENENRTWSEKALSAMGLSVKILFAPITLIAYLIFKSFSKVASNAGLGEEAQVKSVDQTKRSQLLAVGGKEIQFGFNEGAVLEGMFFQTEKPNPNTKTILICTGSHLSYEKYAIPMVETFKSMGYNVMVFNYEGFGNSEGERSEEGVYRSVEAAYQYLKQEKGCHDDNIVGWGYSLGSGAVSDLATKHKLDIVIDRGFSSMDEVAYEAAPNGLKTVAQIIFLVGAHFDNLSKLKKVRGNILVAQGIRDTTMEEDRHGKLLQNAISNKQQSIFRKVDSAHLHSDQVWFGNGEDRRVVENFLNQPHDKV